MRHLLLAAVLALLVPSAASAAWSDASNVGGKPASLAGSVGVADDGSAVTVWTERGGVFYAERASGGAFGVPVRIGRGGIDGAVAVGDGGGAVVVWRDRRSKSVAVAVRPAGGAFGAAKTIADEPSSAPAVAVGATGEATVVWVSKGRIRYADGTLDKPRTLGRGSEPAVAVDAAGGTVVAWVRKGKVVARVRSGESRFGSVTTRSPIGQATTEVAAAIAPDGHTLVVWRSFKKGRRDSEVWADDSRAQNVQRLSKKGDDSYSPAVAIGGDGVGTVAWNPIPSNHGFGGSVYAARQNGDGVFGRARRLSQTTLAGVPSVDANARGDAIVAFDEEIDDEFGEEYVAAAIAPAGGRFGATREVSDFSDEQGSGIDVGLDAQGGAVAVWAADPFEGASSDFTNVIHAGFYTP